MLTSAAAGDVCYVSGTINRTTTDAITATPTVTAPLTIQGCLATDTGTGKTLPLGERTNGFGPLVETNMATIAYSTANGSYTPGKSGIILSGLKITSSQRASSLVSTGGSMLAEGCIINNSTSGAAIAWNAVPSILLNSDIYAANTTSTAINMGNGAVLYGCRVTAGSTGIALTFNTTSSNIGMTVAGCVFYDSLVGFSHTGTQATDFAQVFNCTFRNCATAIVVPNIASTTYPVRVIGCCITDCGTGIDSLYATTLQLVLFNTRFRDNTTANVATGKFDVWKDYFSSVTSGGGTSDYIDAANGDFRLIATSPAAKAGVPSGDIGGVQRTENYPAVTDVKNAVAYGQNSEYTGTYAGGLDLPEPIRIGA